jgi:hypothetical protein
VEDRASALPAPARVAAGVVGAVCCVGLVGAVVAWVRGSGFSSSVAIAYYFVGSITFLVGSFPSGGFSLMRGRTRRRPMGGGAFAAPSMLVGVLMIGLGVLVDVTQLFG